MPDAHDDLPGPGSDVCGDRPAVTPGARPETGADAARPALAIRPYRPADRDGLIALVSLIQREEFGVPITPDEQPDLVDVEGFFGRGAGRFWVAVEGEQIVGSLGLLDAGGGPARTSGEGLALGAEGAARGGRSGEAPAC